MNTTMKHTTQSGRGFKLEDALSADTPIISLWQPWAEWVALGWKKIETRTHSRFAGLVNKRIGIHASQKWDDYAIEAARPYLTGQQLELTNGMRERCKHGAIICTVTVEDFRLLNTGDSASALIECETKRYGLFVNVWQRLNVPAQGKQGIWYFRP